MKFKFPLAAGAVAAAAALLAPQTAFASLVYDSTILVSAQGFGNAPRDLTLSSPNNDTFESGAVGVVFSGGTNVITFGDPILDSQVFMGNGVSTVAGTASLPSPRVDDQKYGIPTIGSLGITTASQIGILFNATEPGGDSANVIDLTLKFYSSTGGFLGAIDGQQNFLSTFPGNGVAGFVFKVDALQQSFVNGLILAGGSGTTLALEASIADATGGPESFTVINLGPVNPVPEPETYALMLAGLGALGYVARRRRQDN
ncbi:MAG: PEP-CTERM sorting domain-containing protein [Pseudomonadota bacterium]|nr:PEP-CTERM sorting domain-containing protein [Pseudomonadota bacterium]